MESIADNPETRLLPQVNDDGAVSEGGLSRLSASTVDGVGGGGAMTTTATSTTSSASAPVPDFLLSLAKDDRYVSELSSLLARVVAPLASVLPPPSSSSGVHARDRDAGRGMTTSHDNDEGVRLVERIQPELDLLASVIVHSAAFVSCYARGGDCFGRPTGDDDGAIRRSLGMESLNLANSYPAKENRGRNGSVIENFADRSAGISPSWKANRWHALLFLQTVVPYIVRRVGRGGWSKDLGGPMYNLLEHIGLVGIVHPGHAGSITNNAGAEDGSALRNDDRLRGLARRRLFLEQRRRMLDSSNDTSHINADDNGDGGSEGNDSNSRRMRRESQLTIANSVGNDRSTFLGSLGSYSLDQKMKRISTFTWNFISRVSLAISSLSHGAHSFPRHSSAANENLDRYAGLIKWFIRLHLALFYWNGMYPTLAHRLVGAEIRDEVVPITTGSPYSNATGAIVANRPTYKPIAAIILFQAIAALSQTTAEASIEVAHCIQVSFFRWRRRRRVQQQRRQVQSGGNPTSDENEFPSIAANSERAEYMDMIEDRVPGISSSKSDVVAEMHKYSAKTLTQPGQLGHQCGICLNERVHPAAPSACGHVFCWDCVLHWVSNVRAECPLCRAPTRPQDIIPLYNYP